MNYQLTNTIINTIINTTINSEKVGLEKWLRRKEREKS
jgi:hypothetical protein